jgi:hypothetical protein
LSGKINGMNSTESTLEHQKSAQLTTSGGVATTTKKHLNSVKRGKRVQVSGDASANLSFNLFTLASKIVRRELGK